MIIVFGTLNIDIYIPAGVLPDAGEHIRLDDYESYPGGKGANQAFAASRSGAKTAIIGQIGDDGFGRRSTRNLKKESILAAGIGMSEKATGCSFLLPGAGEDKTIISCASANLDASADQIPNEALSPRNSVVAQLLIPIEQTLNIFTRARERGCRTILNTSPPQYASAALLKQTDIVFVNHSELEILLKTLDLDTEGDTLAQTKRLSEAFGVDCITTCGSKGALAVYHGRTYKTTAFPIHKVEDATGAGDCFLGYLVGLLDQEYDFATAFQYAAIAGSMACRKRGAQSATPFLEDVAEAAKDFDKPQGQA